MANLVEVAPVDWFRIIQDLCDLHFTLPQISAATDIPRTTLRDWRNLISSPRHHDGELIIAFWCSVTEKTVGNVPRLRTFHM